MQKHMTTNIETLQKAVRAVLSHKENEQRAWEYKSKHPYSADNSEYYGPLLAYSEMAMNDALEACIDEPKGD